MKNGVDLDVKLDVKSKPLTRAGGRPAYRQTCSFLPVAEGLAGDALAELAEAARFLAARQDRQDRQDREERRAFAVAANAIREEEKARLARELHDELAQSLAALKMDTIWVREQVGKQSEKVLARLGGMVQMLDHTVASTRRMAADLRPLLLDDLGLVAAIEWLASGFLQRCGVPCTLSVNEALELELPEPYATALFRIVQESLNNIAKHAAATQAVLTLEKTVDAVKLVVWDDGCGFSPATPRKPQSLGLLGLRERAQLLGGSVAIHSAPGKGTRVEVLIPLNQMTGTF